MDIISPDILELWRTIAILGWLVMAAVPVIQHNTSPYLKERFDWVDWMTWTIRWGVIFVFLPFSFCYFLWQFIQWVNFTR